MAKTICIDIDGTITHYVEWQGEIVFGEVLPKAVNYIRKLKEDGNFIIIYTTRANSEIIAEFLNGHGIPFDSINENPYQPENAKGGKPLADVYIDDRNIPFDGNWETTYQKINNFQTWEEEPCENMIMRDKIEYDMTFMSDDFAQSMEMLRHYDIMNWNITKFAVSEMLIAVGACWSLYTLTFSKTSQYEMMMTMRDACTVNAIICVASLLFGILSISMIWKNRKYFVLTSHHVNEYRNHALQSEPLGFKNKAGYWKDEPFVFYKGMNLNLKTQAPATVSPKMDGVMKNK